MTIALIALTCAVQGYRAWITVREIQHARSGLSTGQEILESERLDAAPQELRAARMHFDDAGEAFASARARMEGDPLLRITRWLPFAGDQADAAITLAAVGESAAAIGDEAIGAAEAVERIRSQDDGRTLLERTIELFEESDPHIAAVEARLLDVDVLRAEIDGASLLPPVRSAVRDLDARRERLSESLETYRRARDLAPGFLGFDGPRTYLVLAQNEAELLPGGGLVSVAGTLRLNQGRIEELDFQDAVQFGEDWMARTGDYIAPPRPLQQYLLKDTSWNLLVSNWSPHFPTSARSAQRFFELGGGPATDGVIAINVHTLQRLLAVTGPVYVPDFDVTVNAENAYDLTEEHTRKPYEAQADRKEFVALLADEVLNRVLRPQPGTWSPLLDALQELGDEKQLMIYAADPSQQQLVREFGWDGEVDKGDGAYLMVVDASVHSTKLNVVLEQKVDVQITLGSDGFAKTTVTVDYFNDLEPWARHREPELVKALMLGGLYGGYLRLFVPDGSRIISVRTDAGEVGLEEVSREQGLSVFGRFFALPRDTRQTLVFEYETPTELTPQGGGYAYRLRLQKQSGTGIDRYRVRVSPPAGMRLEGVTSDGEDAPMTGSTVEVDLSRDRDLVFVLSPG